MSLRLLATQLSHLFPFKFLCAFLLPFRARGCARAQRGRCRSQLFGRRAFDLTSLSRRRRGDYVGTFAPVVILHPPASLCPSAPSHLASTISFKKYFKIKCFSPPAVSFPRSLSCHHDTQAGHALRSECQIRYC